MGTGTRLGGFAVAVAAVFGLAMLLGRVVGPVGEPAVAHDAASAHDTMGSRAAGSSAVPGGLMTSESGYTLHLQHPTVPAGAAVPVAFTITGPDGSPVTAYDVEHGKALHLIAVRRDFTGFQHVHPRLVDGVWRSPLALTPGSWRVFADFRATGGPALTLGADLAVPGRFDPASSTPDGRSAVVDGYRVTLDGDLRGGRDTMLTLEISKDGRPVTDLEPYLGAYGHLVVLRSGDLAYLHVHPDGSTQDTPPGPDVVFHADVPSAGTYHLYLDFKHDGVVRTAAFRLTAGGTGAGGGH